MTDDVTTDDFEVHLTLTARSKTYRMLSDRELRGAARRAVLGREDRIKQRLDPGTGEPLNEYHVRKGKYSVVLKWDEYGEGDGDTIVVVTQSHAHADYADANAWRDVPEVAM